MKYAHLSFCIKLFSNIAVRKHTPKQISQPITWTKWIRGHNIFQTSPNLSVRGCFRHYKFIQSISTGRCTRWLSRSFRYRRKLDMATLKYRANLSQCFLPLAWLLIALSHVRQLNFVWGIGQTLHFALVQSSPWSSHSL